MAPANLSALPRDWLDLPSAMLAHPGPGQDLLGAVGTFAFHPGCLGGIAPSRLSEAPPLLQCHDLSLNLPAKLQRIGDSGEAFFGSTGAGNGQGAESEHPSYDSLIHRDCLDFAEQRFIRLPLDEAHLAQQAFVGDGVLRAGVFDYWRNGEQQSDAGEAGSDIPVSGFVQVQDDPECDAQQHDEDGPEKDGPVQPGAINDALAVEEMIVEIAHGTKIEDISRFWDS